MSHIQNINTDVSLVTVIFISFHSDRTRSNRCNLKEGKSRLEIRRKFFTVKMMRHWNRLPSEAVGIATLAGFKDRMDKPLSYLV